MKENKRYYIVYKTTNKTNKMIYVGVHNTYNLNDKYLGSGIKFKKVLKLEGKENFIKEILFIYDNEADMLAKEAEIVNEEFIARHDTYNIIIGGGKLNVKNRISVRNKEGNTCSVHKTDPRYLNGELVHNRTGFIAAKDNNENIISVTQEIFIKLKLKGVTKGRIMVKDKEKNTFQIDINDPRYLNGELVGITKNMATVKDKNGKNFNVQKNDPRIKSGELVGCTKGMINVKDKNGNIFNISNKDPKYLSGELISIQAKTFFVYDTNYNFISEERGIGKYSKMYNISRTEINKVLNGKKKSYKNFIYSYIKLH